MDQLDLLKYQLNEEYLEYQNLWLLSDIHMGLRSNSLEWINNIKEFFCDFYIPYLKEHKKDNDKIFILGDWYDNRQNIDINVMNGAVDIIIALSSILPVYIICGNHDVYRKNDTDVNSLRTFKYINNVTIYEKPTVITNNKNKILLLPWIGNREDEENYAKANQADYIFAHTDIKGFNYDNGRLIIKGADFSNLKHIKRIFSGHIHKRQEQKKLIYIGSPYHTKRSDIGNQKGFYIFNPNDNKYKFIENKYSSIFQRIKLENMLEYTLEDTIKILDNNYTDIIVPDKYIHLFNLTKFVDILDTCKYKKIEVASEKYKQEDLLITEENQEEIKDILSLLEQNIDNTVLSKQDIILEKMKILNKKYYDLANKDELSIV